MTITTRWREPIRCSRSARCNEGGRGGPTAVACQSALRCSAVGDWFNWCWCGTGTPGHFGQTWATSDGGATWSHRVLPTLGGYDVWYANALSCWATGCAMAGTATTTKPGSGYYALFQALSASGGPLGAPVTSASGLRPQYIDGLSCHSASYCAAVGQDWSKPAAAAIETWASGHWSTTYAGPAPADWDAHVPRHFLAGQAAMQGLSPLHQRPGPALHVPGAVVPAVQALFRDQFHLLCPRSPPGPVQGLPGLHPGD